MDSKRSRSLLAGIATTQRSPRRKNHYLWLRCGRGELLGHGVAEQCWRPQSEAVDVACQPQRQHGYRELAGDAQPGCKLTSVSQSTRALAFVAHSLGGIVCQDVGLYLVHAESLLISIGIAEIEGQCRSAYSTDPRPYKRHSLHGNTTLRLRAGRMGNGWQQIPQTLSTRE